MDVFESFEDLQCISFKLGLVRKFLFLVGYSVFEIGSIVDVFKEDDYRVFCFCVLDYVCYVIMVEN